MSDKVYGFCGRNKCKREVMPTENIGIATGTMSVNGGAYELVKLDYPDGFTFGTCLPLSTIVIQPKVTYPSTGGSSLRIYAELKKDGIWCHADNPWGKLTNGEYQFLVILMKCNYTVG